MIAANTKPSPEAFATRLADRARQIAEAEVATTELARRRDPLRWRKAGLIWPLFAKG